MKTLIGIFLSFLSFPFLAGAQIKSPGSFLGSKPGEKFTRHHQVVDYLTHVAGNSSNVELFEYGSSYEDRPLLLAFISTEDNLKKLEEIRMDNLKRAGIFSGDPATQTGIVWLSYNVHGDESSSTEAAMTTIYELTKEGSDKKSWLEDLVVIVDPCVNPDGRERYVNFFWEHGNQPYNPDPHSIEHRERLPQGRYNHYLFDLNRDWAWQTQIESLHRIKVYNKWLPQIHVDFHEQSINSPYYFAPAAQPYHELITDFQRNFQIRIGKNHARYFDENNWFYFTKEVFDLLYPGYGDTYPTFNGAIGMTYEQAGNSAAGLGVIKQEGDTLTLSDRLVRHVATGLSTIEAAAEHRDRLLSEFEDFFGDKPYFRYRSFVLKYDGNTDKFNHLKQWLEVQGIIYGHASTAKSLSGYDYWNKIQSDFSIQPEDLVINTDQPKATLAYVLLEPQTTLVDSLSYDLTAWSAPYAYGIRTYATERLIGVTEDTLELFTPNDVPEKTYAFAGKWNSVADARFLAALFKNKIRTRVAERPIVYRGNTFDRGSLIIAKRDNQWMKDDFERKIIKLANDLNRPLKPIATGFMDSGPDIGSSNIRYLKPPKIACLRGDDVSQVSFGEVWHFMEQELFYPLTVLSACCLNDIDLHGYDVIIMPGGGYRLIDEEQMKKLIDWVDHGGKVIVIQGSLEKFRDMDLTTLSSYNTEEGQKEGEERKKNRKERSRLTPYEFRQRENVKNFSQAIFKVRLDNTHPLAFGYPDTYFTLKTRPGKVAYLEEGNVGIILSEEDLMSGFAGQYVREDIKETLSLGVERIGNGQIVYFVDDPLIRSFWQNGKLLFANALFFVGQ